MEQQCRVAEVSRASFYRHLDHSEPRKADMLLRGRLQELAVAHHRVRGYRMLTALLRREGQQVNHKRVLRLMREDNLLSLRRKKYVFTTDSAHSLPIYPNLARHVKLTAANQLWVSDITFIRLRDEFIYLAVVLDAYSRKVVGWNLGRSLEAELALGALRMALNRARLESRRADPPLRSRGPVCIHGLHRVAGTERYPDQHESPWKSLRQRSCGTVHADAERGASQRS